MFLFQAEDHPIESFQSVQAFTLNTHHIPSQTRPPPHPRTLQRPEPQYLPSPPALRPLRRGLQIHHLPSSVRGGAANRGAGAAAVPRRCPPDGQHEAVVGFGKEEGAILLYILLEGGLGVLAHLGTS